MIKLLDTRNKIVLVACISMLILSACSSVNKESTAETFVMPSEVETLIAETSSEAEETSIEEETTADVTEAETESQGDYVFPNSDKEYVPFEDANSKSNDELRIGRNEIYARHGRKFSDEKLQAYFDSRDWYQGTIEPNDFDESVLSIEEKYNVKDFSNLEGQRELVNNQSYRYDYDGTAYANVNGMRREKESTSEGDYIIVTPIDFNNIRVEFNTHEGNRTAEFQRGGYSFGEIYHGKDPNYENIMELGKSELSFSGDGNDAVTYYAR